MHDSRSRNAVVRVFDTAGNMIETHEHTGDFNGLQCRAGFLLHISPQNP